MAGPEFIHCCQQNLRQKLLSPVLDQAGYPSHLDLFYILIKANKGLEQNHLDGTSSKKLIWVPDPAEKLVLMGETTAYKGRGKKTKPQLISGLSLTSFTETTAEERKTWGVFCTILVSYGWTKV